ASRKPTRPDPSPRASPHPGPACTKTERSVPTMTMLRGMPARALAGAAVAALAASVAACTGTASGSSGPPTVTMMVGGIDKQIYLPYELAQRLGYYRKYGINMVLSTEQTGGAGAANAVASGQGGMAGARDACCLLFSPPAGE